MYENFIRWGYNGFLMVIAGLMEGIGAILLIIPKTRLYGAFVLITVMVAAAITHFLNFEELGWPLLNAGLIALLSLIIYWNNMPNINLQKS